MATVSQTNGGSTPQASPASSGTATGAAAAFLNLISLLLGSDAASTPAQDSAAGSDNAPAATDDKSRTEAAQTNSTSGTGVILIALSPPAACAPVVPTAGAAKAGTADGIAKPGDDETKKKRRTPEQKIVNDLLAMTASQAPAAAVVPLVAPRPPAAGAASASATAQSAGVPGGNSAPPPAHAGFIAGPPPAPNASEPPVAFVLELKPNDRAVAEPATGVQTSPPTPQPAPAAKATDLNTTAKPALANPGEQAAARDTHADSAPIVSKADPGPGNRRDDSNDAGRAKQQPGHDQQQERDAPVSDAARSESILKPADAAPIAMNGRLQSQPERTQDALFASESMARAPATTAPAEQPKQAQVREISFQSTSPEAGAVKVQVIDRGGDVRISVRSSDPNLTHALQRDVGQLVTKLDHSGYETKAWSPRDPAPLAGLAELRDIRIRPETGSNSNSGSDSGSRGGQGGASDQSQQQRRHGDARQWTSTLDDSVNKTNTEDEEDLWQA